MPLYNSPHNSLLSPRPASTHNRITRVPRLDPNPRQPSTPRTVIVVLRTNMTPKLEHGPSPTDVSVRGKKDSQFPFLSLPSELRIKVYEQTLLSDTDRKPRNDFAIIRATYMSLSQTCKQIRSEVQHEAIGILNHYLYAVRRNWILAFDCSLHIRNSHILSFPQIAIGRVVFPTVASGTTQQREIGTHFCLQ
jgi:hypothetical protein